MWVEASFSGTVPPNSAVVGYAIEGAHLITFVHLVTEIACIHLTLSVPSVIFTKGLSSKTVEATQR